MRFKGLMAGVDLNTAQQAHDVSHSILLHRRLGEADISNLPDKLTSRNMLHSAQVFAALANGYRQLEETGLRDHDEYMLGFILADFLEVLRPEQAAVVLGSALDPGVSAQIRTGKGLKALRGFDVVPYAVEAAALLPAQRLEEIFAAMARLDREEGKKMDGKAWRSLSFLVSCSSGRSDYNLSRLISRNISGTAGQEKLIEVMQGFGNVRWAIKKELGMPS
jgi:hypothetical protein